MNYTKGLTDMLDSEFAKHVRSTFKERYSELIETILQGNQDKKAVVLVTVVVTQALLFLAFATLLVAWMFCCGGWDRYVMPLFTDDGQADLDAEIDEQAMSVFEGAIKRTQKAQSGEGGAEDGGSIGARMFGAKKAGPNASNKKKD